MTTGVGYLIHSPADILRWALIDLGVGSDPVFAVSWPIYEAQEPDTPDDVITAFGQKGKTYGRNQLTGQTIEKPAIQLRIRSIDSTMGNAKASEIAKVLDEEVYNRIVTISHPFFGFVAYCLENASRSGMPISLPGNVVPLGRSAPSTSGVTAPSSTRFTSILHCLVSVYML